MGTLEVEPDAGSLYGGSAGLYVGLGASVGSQYRSICRIGSQCRGCNSTSSLVIMFGALEKKNRVIGSQTREPDYRHNEVREPA